jgi:hypothetical protein
LGGTCSNPGQKLAIQAQCQENIQHVLALSSHPQGCSIFITIYMNVITVINSSPKVKHGIPEHGWTEVERVINNKRMVITAFILIVTF